MSEPILQALIKLFALIIDVHDNAGISSKGKDVVRLFLLRHLDNESVERYMEIFNEYLKEYHSENIARGSIQDRKRTSLTSMRILAICEKINEELHHKQKLYVLIQLIDFILLSAEISENELDFLETVSTSFSIQQTEYQNIKNFILSTADVVPEKSRVMIIDNKNVSDYGEVKHLFKENLKGSIYLLFIETANTYIFRYSGEEDLFLNGQHIFTEQTYAFEFGSTIRGSAIGKIYYNDVNTIFNEEAFKVRINLDATDISMRFKDSENGIHQMSFHEESGKLVGILGGSGVGKSTLLNVLSGVTEPDCGTILINGFNLYSEKDKQQLKGVIGFIPQDDLLQEDLTVYQNLYYNARMCLDNLSEEKLKEAVNKTLIELDLDEIRDLKVGNPLNKIISGGQRKRLNIALELIREPTILFVDEPTSGLSSVDSEIVMNLLKEQTYRGKLVIVNIHQPGSDIYKMFDKIMIMDKGGYQIFNGIPNEAVIYFKRKANLANADVDQCVTCGNVNPEQLLQIIESKVVDERGKPTHVRKVSPKEWAEKFKEETTNINKEKKIQGEQPLPENFYSIPGLLKQSKIFLIRDLLSKLSNRQYVMISLLGAPLLALLLAHFTKFSAGDKYTFSGNENLPAYLFMCVITSLFLGLIISAEEIVRDRKILKRESFLNLSWMSYLNSKIMMMFIISAIQTISFILIGNCILEIKGMTLPYWLILFTTSCLANLMGLNISSAFSSVITIYILIPFILIPQLLFSGVLVKFDKLHIGGLSSREYVPIIGDLMPSRWSFEALAVEQFKNNRYKRNFIENDIEISNYEWYAKSLIGQLQKDLKYCYKNKDSIQYRQNVVNKIKRLNKYLDELTLFAEFKSVPEEARISLNAGQLNSFTVNTTEKYLDSLRRKFYYLEKDPKSSNEIIAKSIAAREGGVNKFIDLKTNYYNDRLEDIILYKERPDWLIERPDENKVIRIYQPGLMEAESKFGRAHFFAPDKTIGNHYIDTFWFNTVVLWLVTFILYIALCFNILQKIIAALGNIRFRKSEKPVII
jgi:ABC transport system ATP-binding/permease protein